MKTTAAMMAVAQIPAMRQRVFLLRATLAVRPPLRRLIEHAARRQRDTSHRRLSLYRHLLHLHLHLHPHHGWCRHSTGSARPRLPPIAVDTTILPAAAVLSVPKRWAAIRKVQAARIAPPMPVRVRVSEWMTLFLHTLITLMLILITKTAVTCTHQCPRCWCGVTMTLCVRRVHAMRAGLRRCECRPRCRR